MKSFIVRREVDYSSRRLQPDKGRVRLENLEFSFKDLVKRMVNNDLEIAKKRTFSP